MYKSTRPANDEMVRGFMDGYDKDAPEPGPNTSRSYRHGFECGRDDILNRSRFDCDTLRKMAEEAMEADSGVGALAPTHRDAL